jgi:hypothetical protein
LGGLCGLNHSSSYAARSPYRCLQLISKFNQIELSLKIENLELQIIRS